MADSRSGAEATQRRSSIGRRLGGLIAALVALTAGMAIAPAAQAAPDSQGTEFWLAFPGNFNGGSEKTLFITGRDPASGTVEMPGLGFSAPFTVTPGTVTSVVLPGNSDLDTAEGIQPKGIHVTADQEVTVYGLNRLQFTTDAYLGLPVDVLGGSNLVLGIGTGLGGTSEFAFAASQDATTVTVTPTVDGNGGRTAGVPYDVVLNKGDAYQLRAATAQQDLSGTVLESDKPIAVFGGHQCANIPDTGFFACDHVVEQMPPVETWGRDFLTVPLKTRTGGDTFRILAAEDNTQVSINGAVVATLNRGQVHQQIIDGQSTISADKAVLVGQYSNSSSFDGVTSDPFEMLIPPREQFLDGYTVTTPASGFPNNFINLVVADSDVGNVAVDGTAVPPGSFTPIGSTGFSGTQVDVSIGAHNLTGASPFGAFQYGFASFDSYGYAGGQSFAPIRRVASITVEPPTETVVVGTEGCVTATARDENGIGVPDVRIDFVASGANSATGFANANADGSARFCYTGANVGNDTIGAAVGQISGTAAKTWIQLDGITVEPPSQTVRVNTQQCVTATPRSGGATVPNLRIDFVVTGANSTTGSVTTDASGNARFCYTGTNLGDDTITASVGQTSGSATKTWIPSLGICKGQEVDIVGTSGNDTIIGTDAADVISGNGGNDKISGLEGKDTICGRSGDDKIDGGKGDDQLLGGKKRDQVDGDDGDDFVRGQTGKDKLGGGEGNDKLVANKGADVLKGDDGNDKLDASNGDDNLFGGAGNDKLDGGPGNNSCFPDGGDNTEKNC